MYFYYSMCYDKIVTNQMNITHTRKLSLKVGGDRIWVNIKTGLLQNGSYIFWEGL